MANNRNKSPRPVSSALHGITAVCSLAVAGLMAAVPATRVQAAENRVGYLTGSSGQPVIGEAACVHTGEWVAGMHYERCDAMPAKASLPAPIPARARASEKPVISMPHAQPVASPQPFKLALDTLFDFDRAVLKPQGRSLLDELSQRMDRVKFHTMDIVGHSDRIGAASYNQRLSERRARAVRDYLVAHGLDAAKLTAEGVGESEPVTATGQCKEFRGRRLIECLQPDRYAELKVSGSAPDTASKRALLGLESGKTASLLRPERVGRT
jgi:OmpA-OmpF porin, OOP family